MCTVPATLHPIGSEAICPGDSIRTPVRDNREWRNAAFRAERGQYIDQSEMRVAKELIFRSPQT